MSRCFPYPPTGWSRNGAQFGAVNESIKSKKEIIADRQKEKRRDNRHGRKDKVKDKEGKSLSKLSFYQGKKNLPPKSVEDEVEKSDLTEEHDQPVYCQGRPYLSEGTDSSGKRKRDDSTASEVKITGNIIRIKLRKNEDRAASFGGDQLCSTTGRVDSIPQEQDVMNMPGSEHIVGEINSGQAKPFLNSISVTKNKNYDNHVENVGSTGSSQNVLQSKESPYKKLFEDWVPPPFQLNLAADDDDGTDWLFGTKKQERNVPGKVGLHVEATNYDYTSWPKAGFIPEADVYTLPYTVPF